MVQVQSEEKTIGLSGEELLAAYPPPTHHPPYSNTYNCTTHAQQHTPVMQRLTQPPRRLQPSGLIRVSNPSHNPIDAESCDCSAVASDRVNHQWWDNKQHRRASFSSLKLRLNNNHHVLQDVYVTGHVLKPKFALNSYLVHERFYLHGFNAIKNNKPYHDCSKLCTFITSHLPN